MAASNALTSINGTNGYQQHVEIDPSRPLTLSVSNASGEVQITSSEQPGLWIVVRRADGQASDGDDEIPVSVNVDGNSITVHPDWTMAGGLGGLAKKIKQQLQHGFDANEWNLSNFRLNPDLNYDIRVQIPTALAADSKVTVKTASGALKISGVNATLAAATASGATEVRKVNGTTSIHSASGSILAEQITGSLEANTASGSIAVTGHQGWTALRTVSGSIRFDQARMSNARIVSVSGSVKGNLVADNSEEYSFETVSGSIKLEATLPANAQSTLSYKAISGSAKAGGDWVARGKRSWIAGTGEQGPRFTVKTVSGSLHADARTDHQVVTRHKPLPVAGPPVLVDEPGSGEPHELERGIAAATAWVKDFARDLSSSSTPPPPAAPPSPAQPAEPAAPPTPPSPPAAPESPEAAMDATSTAAATPPNAAEPVEPAPRPTQPWTWSTGSGAPPPAGQATEPIDTPAPAESAGKGTVEDLTGDDTDRLKILEALERGEIDVEEALAKLDTDEARES